MTNPFEKLLSRLNAYGTLPSGPGLSAQTVAAYNNARGKSRDAHICHAPFSNMYFNVHGDCAPCWLTFLEPDSYPAKSIREIWFGEKYQSLREHLLKYNLTHKCNVCLKNLQTGNYTSVLARAYDVNKVGNYPSMMELELSNTCNLECVMCIGELSSSIRRNREHLPPLQNAYDDNFIEQMEEFIPHLHELRFNGGEPFLIEAVYKIFAKVEKVHPKLKIVVATNGTVLNQKVKTWLEKLNIHINLSLDSLTPDIYEAIRVNARFNRVMDHFHFYLDYIKRNNRTLCIMVNPMRNNWHEMPEYIRMVNKHNINVWFNTIHRPVDWALWSLPHNKLQNIYDSLSSVKFSKEEQRNSLAAYNLGIYHNLVNVQIKNWVREAKERETHAISDQNQIDEAKAKSIVENNLTEFVYSGFNEGEEQKQHRLQQLFSKLERIRKLLAERNGALHFYSLIFKTPSDVLYTRLDTKSTNSLVDDFEKWILQDAPR